MALLASIPALLVSTIFLSSRFGADPQPARESQPGDAPLPSQQAGTAPAVSGSLFRSWMNEVKTASQLEDALLQEGVRLAGERMAYMRGLMARDPGRALAESLTLAEWTSLPEVIRPYVEEPFSAVADVDVCIACEPDSAYTESFTTLPSGRHFRTFSSGNRRLAKTKKGIPVQGIHLDDLAVVRNRVFQMLDGDDLDAAMERYASANLDNDRCFSTGEPLGEDARTALAGGRLFHFKDAATLDALESDLQALDELAGPQAGSSYLFSALNAYASTNGFDLAALEQLATEEAAAWTAEVRDMYVILVDFDDQPGEPASPSLLEYYIDTYVSQQISDMSHGKSSIDCTVSTNTYRMPWLSTAYVSDHRPMHGHAVAAAVADGVDLSSYETVCVYFKWIPGITFSGYADIGGDRMWIQHISSINIVTIIHELGHNYGSYHSHSWDVTGNDPVDPAGTHTEYGDFSDIMGSGGFPKGHFHVQNKLEVQWLTADNIAYVTNSGTYRVHRTDHPDTDPESAALRGMHIEKDATNAYWIGYRQLYPEHEYYGRGTYVLWQQPNPSNYPKCHLLDMTPGSAGGKQDGGLALGQTYSDPAAQVHITPVRRGGYTPDEWMDVTVNLGEFTANSAPVASLSGPANGTTWESMTFAVDATDPDGDSLAYFWDVGDGLIKDNSRTMSYAWRSVGMVTGTVKCTVSDMKGGVTELQHTVILDEYLESWPHQYAVGIAHLLDIATDDEIAVAVGTGGFVTTSTNGTDWTSGNVGGSFANVYLENLIHDGTQFISAGRDYSFASTNWVGVVYTSTDGTSWTKRYDSGSAGWLMDVARGDGIRVAVGYYGTILRSTDGHLWSPVAAGISDNLRSIAYGNGVFTAVGTAPSGTAVVYTSPDGLSWTDRSAGAGLTNFRAFYDIEYCNDLFLAGGWYAGIRRSENQGVSFDASESSNYEIPAFAYGKGIYFAAGINKDAADADINLVSGNGIDWTVLSAPVQQNRNAAVFFNDRFITVGQSGSIWRSDPIGRPESGWALWQYHNRTALGINRDSRDDADGDGVLNIVEYALGSLADNSSSTPSIIPAFDGDDHLEIVIDRTFIAGDIDYVVERNTNLLESTAWSSLDTEIVSNTATQLVVRSTYPVDVHDSEFLRLSITLKSPSP
jgi:hypothetical protein